MLAEGPSFSAVADMAESEDSVKSSNLLDLLTVEVGVWRGQLESTGNLDPLTYGNVCNLIIQTLRKMGKIASLATGGLDWCAENIPVMVAEDPEQEMQHSYVKTMSENVDPE